jgi:uncharacterized membrane protein YfcA
MAVLTILGVLWGGRMGPFIAQWVSARWLKLVFVWIAMLDGVVIVVQVVEVSL